MNKTTAEAEPSFTQPYRQIFLMLVVIGLVSAGGVLAWPQLSGVFLANIWLNGFIGCVFIFGVLACFWQMLQLSQSILWIVGFSKQAETQTFTTAPRLLAPLAALLRSRGVRMQISATSSRSILDSVATRIDEARDITRYLVNLLIFLGLLGTFYGLATTVPAIVDTIRNLAPQQGESGVQVFDKLMGGLEAQLGGMGTAFSSSLLGLAGSLVVGLLELFASHGQNRFYRELEEWLSTITRLGFSTGDSDAAAEGEHSDLAVVATVLEQMATQMQQMQGVFAESAAAATQGNVQIAALAQSVSQLSERMAAQNSSLNSHLEKLSSFAGAQNAVLAEISKGQQTVLPRLATAQEAQLAVASQLAEAGGADAESRMRLRSIDVQLLRILEELSAGRQESVTDLRADIATLTQAIRQLSRGQNVQPGGRG
jgi:hypothetical protein